MVLNNNNSRNKLEKIPCSIRVLHVFYPVFYPCFMIRQPHPFFRPFKIIFRILAHEKMHVASLKIFLRSEVTIFQLASKWSFSRVLYLALNKKTSKSQSYSPGVVARTAPMHLSIDEKCGL